MAKNRRSRKPAKKRLLIARKKEIKKGGKKYLKNKRLSIKSKGFLFKKKNKSKGKTRKTSYLKNFKKIRAKIIRKIKVRKIEVKRKKIKSPVISNGKNDFLAGSLFKAKIKVIGIGGGGGSIVSEIGKSLNKAKFVIADTDNRAFKKREGIKYFSFGQKVTHGLGTGLDPRLGKIAAEKEKEKIAKIFDGQDMIIFVASLGGGVGSGAAQVFADVSKDFQGVSLGIFTIPFKFEGKNKSKIALNALRQLRKSLDVSITIFNEKIFKVIDSNTPITEAFSVVNKNLIKSLESLIDLIYNPGVINIDFADLRTVLKGKGNLAFLNTVEASGKNRLEKISQEILYNPLCQNPIARIEPPENQQEYNNKIDSRGAHKEKFSDRKSSFLVQKILFNVAGGSSLSMFEVDKISRMIAEQNPKAKIIFGISRNSKYKDKIKVTILMTGLPNSKIGVSKKKKAVVMIKKSRMKAKITSAKRKFVAKSKSLKRNNLPKNKRKFNKTNPKKNNNQDNLQSGIDSERALLIDKFIPSFNNASVAVGELTDQGPIQISQNQKRLPINSQVSSGEKSETVRRTALEIKKAQEADEIKKSKQEKEWEIPAFLRLKK